VLQWGAQPTLRRGAAIASHKKKVACAHPNCSTPPDPWQRFLRQARRFWDLHSLGMQNQRSIRKERTLFQAFQRQSDLLYFRLQQSCYCAGALLCAWCRDDSARLLGAIQVLSKTACALSMAPKRSARLTIALLLLNQEDCVAGMAVAARRCATLRAARLVPKHVVVALDMVPKGGATLMDAPPRQHKGSSIAPHTAAGRRRGRAPWRAAPPPLLAKASAANMAAAMVNARLLAVPTRCTAFSRPAGDTAGVGTASIHQDASRQQLSTAQTAGSTPRRRRRIDLHSLGMQNQRARRKDNLQGVDARTPLMCNVL